MVINVDDTLFEGFTLEIERALFRVFQEPCHILKFHVEHKMLPLGFKCVLYSTNNILLDDIAIEIVRSKYGHTKWLTEEVYRVRQTNLWKMINARELEPKVFCYDVSDPMWLYYIIRDYRRYKHERPTDY